MKIKGFVLDYFLKFQFFFYYLDSNHSKNRHMTS